MSHNKQYRYYQENESAKKSLSRRPCPWWFLGVIFIWEVLAPCYTARLVGLIKIQVYLISPNMLKPRTIFKIFPVPKF